MECQAITKCVVSYSIWNFENGSRLNHFENGNPKATRITAMELLNSHDLPLLLTGSSMYFYSRVS